MRCSVGVEDESILAYSTSNFRSCFVSHGFTGTKVIEQVDSQDYLNCFDSALEGNISFIFRGTRSLVVRCLRPLFWCTVVNLETKSCSPLQSWWKGHTLMWKESLFIPVCRRYGEEMENTKSQHLLHRYIVENTVDFPNNALFRNIWQLLCIRYPLEVCQMWRAATI